MASLENRVRGGIYGLAIGDALGGPVEFQKRGTFTPVTGYRHNPNFNLPPGAWTDDTSMALCLAESLVENAGVFVLHDQIARYIRWFFEGHLSATGYCFDIGNATRQALIIWQRSFDADASVNKVEQRDGRLPGQAAIDSALDRERSCGNGSLMRCISIPLVFNSDLDLALKHAAKASLPTHPHEICIEACQLYTRLVVGILSVAKPTKASVFASFREHQLQSPVMSKAFSKYRSLDDFGGIPESDIASSGFVVHTLEAALWTFFTTDSFIQGAFKVVNLGDDADTVGAVYGGLAGAFYGFDSISPTWVQGLYARDTVDRIAEGLIRLTSASGSD